VVKKIGKRGGKSQSKSVDQKNQKNRNEKTINAPNFGAMNPLERSNRGEYGRRALDVAIELG